MPKTLCIIYDVDEQSLMFAIQTRTKNGSLINVAKGPIERYEQLGDVLSNMNDGDQLWVEPPDDPQEEGAEELEGARGFVAGFYFAHEGTKLV